MAFKNTRIKKKSLIPSCCEIPDCDFDVFVTRHRIKPGRKGGKYIAGNVIGLCPNHHALAELGFYTQFELFQIVQLRLKLEQNNRVGENNGYSTWAAAS